MGKKLDKFLLLMWKNFLTQWRYPTQTLIEILAPAVLASLLVVLRSLVYPESYPASFYLPFENKLTNTMFRPTIAWCPQNPILEAIMNSTVESINTKNNLSQFFSYRHIGFKNRNEFDIYLKSEINIARTMAGVLFDNSTTDADKLNPYMNVIFRFPAELRNIESKLKSADWQTNQLFPAYQTPGPRGKQLNEGGPPSYHKEGFLVLQQELSFSIINQFKLQMKDTAFDKESVSIYMQRFPYPKYTHDLLITALQRFVGILFMLSFVYTCISTVKMVTSEKEKQLKEAMKIMGLPNWLHWSAWFLKTFILLLITIILMVILLKATWYPGTEYTIFTHSNPFVILLFLVFYISATITFCFAISVFFSKANTAATLAGLLWFLSYFPFSLLTDSYNTLTLGQKLSVSLCANTAMGFGFQLTLMFEGLEEGLQWHNIWKTVSPDDDLTLGHIMTMLAVDALIYLLVALYVEAVFPGENGVPQPWYFLFTPWYWIGNSDHSETENAIEHHTGSEFFEKEPTHLQAGIKIRNLRKTYSKKVAVKNLTLNMYKDHITVLLGHNGAGKTTTMSILTGMFPPTSGTALIEGCDIKSNINGVRKSLGLCLQHNILFDELTVKEHLYFYSRLKGMDKKASEKEIDKYVELLELVPKADSLSSTLSGGMKRKLSVGIALCGDSKVVMLDEPTAGMDPSARRALWDLLLTQKKGRTILLSTHFMDEADLLGDRIAIMAGGQLQCCGSSFFLKKKYGAGYHLIMDKTPQCNVDAVTHLLKNYIPNVEIEGNIGSELSYVLNEEHSGIFENMLSDLETQSSHLGVLSYGISLTTLEEVFMKVGADHGEEEFNRELAERGDFVENNLKDFEENMIASELAVVNGSKDSFCIDTKLESREHLLKGCKLWLNQIMAMTMKRGLSILRGWILCIIQIAIPVLFLSLTILFLKNTGTFQQLPSLKFQLDSYNNPVTVLTRFGADKYSANYIEMLNMENKRVINWEDGNLTINMIEETEKNPKNVRLRYINGATFYENNSIIAWFNNDPLHSAPLALQLVINSILQTELESPNYHIQFFNHPLPFSLRTEFSNLSKGNNMGFQIAFNLGFSMAFVSAFYLMFYVRERVSKAKHLQFVSGVGVLSFWIPSFLCDFLMFLFNSFCICVTLAILQEDGFRTFSEIGRLYSLLFVFGFSMLPMMYLFAFLFDVPSTGFTRMTLVNVITGVAVFMIVQILGAPQLELEHVADIINWIFLIVPHFSLVSSIQSMNLLYSVHKICNVLIESCVHPNIPEFPNITIPPQLCKQGICLFVQKQCCDANENYFDIQKPGVGKNIIFSIGGGVILITLLLLIEYRFFEYIIYKLTKSRSSSTKSADVSLDEDEDVTKEKQKIRNLQTEEIKKTTLVMKDVTKYYGDYLAVNSTCLQVNRYDCFGLLGVNGAGKTTTFKMMTGDIRFSSGVAWINGLNLNTEMKKIYQFIGYCPQFDALLDDLTCRETLKIFGLLRGITNKECKIIAERLAHQFDFYQHLDKKIKELSGGNKRKVSTAIALIGDPLIIYLDEPTTGMDPATKRYLWNAICKIRDSGKCIVLTSHSMEECEALCTRLAIMVNGVFKCLGSSQHLKSKFSEGYTLTIKIQKNEDSVESLETIENFVKDKFSSVTVREQHQEMITFHIADKSQPWSKMFGIMEQAKKSLNVEDYSLGQSSLEQTLGEIVQESVSAFLEEKEHLAYELDTNPNTYFPPLIDLMLPALADEVVTSGTCSKN